MHWKELLPIDRYIVQMKDRIHETDRDVLTLLYQPLIGSLAYSLYLTLWAEAEGSTVESRERKHQTLMVLTGRPLDEIFQERKKLEAIGLLAAYREKSDDEVLYIYELRKPLSPAAFFQDDLSVFLYNRLGKEQFRRIRDRFTVERKSLENAEEVTRSFDEVFKSLHQSEMVSYDEDLQSGEKNLRGQKSKEGYAFSGKDFDYDLMLADLPPFVNKEALGREKVKRAVSQLAFVYKVEPLEMSKFVQDTMLHDDELDMKALRAQVQRRYRMQYSHNPPSLALRRQPVHLVTQQKEPETEAEKMILYYETTSPMEMLQNVSDGAKVPPGDMEIVEHLMLDYRLTPGVVNVLIDYILMINEMKLTKGFADKIAGQWSRKNISTVKQAMEIAKQEYKNRKQFAEAKKDGRTRQSGGRKKPVRRERLPKWLEEQKSREETAEQKAPEPAADKPDAGLEQKREELAKLKEKYKKK
ncbi:replication initiation and membrane attachment family protein [Alteribacter natronophilus]|uniref:replication initiation and membrane attachment family protein n=1 Tax=Alteribacter natronophilus TaxID=2583810 RepID=UPI001485DD1E|nr:DnaD domain protein [Alteribacter natronophilus]